MALRELLVQFTTAFDTKPLDAGNAKITGLTGKLRDFGVALAGAFAVSKVKDFVFGLAGQADALAKTSKALNLPIKELQAWQHAASLSGVSTEAFNSAFTRFNRNVAEAADEATAEAAEAFDALGVKVKDATGKLRPPVELLDEIAAGMAKIEEPAKRTQVAMDLFGRTGAKLLPLFAEGPEGIAKLRAELEELGGGFSEDFAKASEQMNDDTERLGLSLLSLKVRIAGFLVPAINTAVLWITKKVNAFRKATEGTNLLQAAFAVLGTVAAVQAALIVAKWAPILKALGRTAFLIGAAILLLEDLIATFQGKDTVIRRIIDGWFGEGATAKVVAWFQSIGTGFAQMVDDARFRNDEFRSTWEATLEDIRNDFSGTFGEYIGGVLAAAVDTVFVAINGISGGWSGFFDMMKALLDGLFFSFEVVFEDIVHVTLSAIAVIADGINSVLKLASNIPGLGDLAPDPNRVSKRDQEKGRRQRAEGELFARAQDIDNRLRGQTAGARVAAQARADFSAVPQPGSGVLAPGVAPSMAVQAPIVIHVPPGTPAQQARAVGNAAQAGVNRGAAAAFRQRGKP